MRAVPEIRPATPADATAMAAAHVDSIRSLGPAFYRAELVDAWAAGVTPAILGFSSTARTAATTARRATCAAAITMEASLPGVPFYRAHGFVEIEPRDVCLRSGASIPCVLMRKQLAGTTAG